MRQVSFQPNGAIRVQYGKKRFGPPRRNWLHFAKQHGLEHSLRGYEYNETVVESHGSLSVPIEHHPTIRYMVYNGFYKVMSNIPKSWDI